MRNPRRTLALAGLLLAAACQDRQPAAPNLLQPRADSIRVCGAEGEAPCTLGPVTGTVDPIRPTDDEGGEDDGGTGGGEGDVGGGGGGSGSGGGSTPSDDPLPSDTACRATGDTLVDKTQVQDIFDAVWAGSNADASSSVDRLERGGWIVKTAAGYAFREFTDMRFEPCGITPLSPAALEPPAGAVAWVHTHPFRVGEYPYSCRYVDPSSGLIGIPEYGGTPSQYDVLASEQINARLAARGLPPIDGFVLDKNAIVRFKPLGTGGAWAAYPSIRRCAY
ncbi:MAG TPA: hypothetical protein VHG91_21475 [Longimicrobium sp.]|nr:hypothetical protein [Longimicrobium sp.]